MSELKNTEGRRTGVSPWLVILATAPLPLILLGVFLFKWNKQQTDLNQATSHLLRRQNKVLAYDAMGVSRRVSDLLESMVRDLNSLALLREGTAEYIKFHNSHTLRVSRFDKETLSLTSQHVPTYNLIAKLNSEGKELMRLENGTPAKTGDLSSCKLKNLCDRDLWEQSLKANLGQVTFGKLLRIYSSKDEPEVFEGAGLRISLRTSKAIYILGLDYRHLKEILYIPSFPFEPRADLLQAYAEGNYIYYMDHDLDFIAHPKYWHVQGVSVASGERMPAAGADSDLGVRPLNVEKYQGQELRDYFIRLLNVSFTSRNIDIFRASNLTGKIRVLSVAPILFNRGQFEKTGVFGHVITGCNVEYFEEPKEKYLPYF